MKALYDWLKEFADLTLSPEQLRERLSLSGTAVEGLAQTAGALCVSSFGTTYKPQLVYFMGIDRAKFRKPVLPGDQLHYHVRKIRSRGKAWRFHGEAKVNGQLVAEAEVSAMIIDPDEYQKKA